MGVNIDTIINTAEAYSSVKKDKIETIEGNEFIKKLNQKVETKRENNLCDISSTKNLTMDERNMMSIEEYKIYFYDKISDLMNSVSQKEIEILVEISEEAFQKMKEDPIYEAQIINYLKRDLGANYMIDEPAFCIIQIGATTKEYRVSTFGRKQRELFRRKQKDSFWERRAERKKKLKKELEKKLLKKEAERTYLNKLAADKYIARNIKEQAITEAISRSRAGFQVNLVEVKMASRAYETHFNTKELMRQIGN